MAMAMQLRWTKRTERVERVKEMARLDHTKVGPGKSAYAACLLEDIDKLPPRQTMVKVPRDVLAILVACAGHQVRRPVVRAALGPPVGNRVFLMDTFGPCCTLLFFS